MDELPPILVVDDEMLVRLAMTEALQSGGYRVVEAADGNAAIQFIDDAEALRGLVTDIRLPGVNGWEVAHHARQKFPLLAIIYVTGDSAHEWSANGVPQSTVMQKPFADAEIVTALANMLVAQQPPQSDC